MCGHGLCEASSTCLFFCFVFLLLMELEFGLLVSMATNISDKALWWPISFFVDNNTAALVVLHDETWVISLVVFLGHCYFFFSMRETKKFLPPFRHLVVFFKRLWIFSFGQWAHVKPVDAFHRDRDPDPLKWQMCEMDQSRVRQNRMRTDGTCVCLWFLFFQITK